MKYNKKGIGSGRLMLMTSIISISVCILMIISILSNRTIKIKKYRINLYWIIALIGAILVICFGLITPKQVINGLVNDTIVNPLKILTLFFSMTILSIFLDEVGFFKYLASKASKFANNSQVKLFIILYLLVSTLTVFTSNDIVILTFTPFICYFCKNAKINPIPYLVGEFAAANTWSMVLVIGNPTNIYLASTNNIDFISYLKVMIIPTIMAGITELLMLLLIFNKKLKEKAEIINDEVKIDDNLSLFLGLFHLLFCIIMLAVSSYINIDMWIICLTSACSLIIIELIIMIIRKSKDNKLLNSIKRLPYELIPFVLSMFILVGTLQVQGITDYIRKLLGENNSIFVYGISSFFVCNLINNIPMSVLYSTLPMMNSNIENLKAIYATIIGSNIGAFLTPIGALAGIMFTSLLKKQNIEYKFKDFVKYGTIISIPTLLVSLIFLMFMF